MRESDHHHDLLVTSQSFLRCGLPPTPVLSKRKPQQRHQSSTSPASQPRHSSSSPASGRVIDPMLGVLQWIRMPKVYVWATVCVCDPGMPHIMRVPPSHTVHIVCATVCPNSCRRKASSHTTSHQLPNDNSNTSSAQMRQLSSQGSVSGCRCGSRRNQQRTKVSTRLGRFRRLTPFPTSFGGFSTFPLSFLLTVDNHSHLHTHQNLENCPVCQCCLLKCTLFETFSIH